MPSNINPINATPAEVLLDQKAAQPQRAPQVKASTSATAPVRPAATTEQKPTRPAQPEATPVFRPPETDVTFRRDSNGRVFYVVTDSQSGKELEELPPQAVRKVAQGIEDYLKQQIKAATHLEEEA